eukprot:6607154-Alexandrium_andersonii.AAC.1
MLAHTQLGHLVGMSSYGVPCLRRYVEPILAARGDLRAWQALAAAASRRELFWAQMSPDLRE